MDHDDKATAMRLSASDTPADDDDRPGTEGDRKRNRKKGRHPNNVRKIRIERMMSKAELARRANLSVLTVDRVEKGFGCRMDTKRKILEALGLSLADRVRVFGEEE
jgi:DNA-binding XRE family transcriptional regulator